jgi:hypothetical protein
VDLRRSSSTFKQWWGIDLNGKNHFMLWVPRDWRTACWSPPNRPIFFTSAPTFTVLRTNGRWLGTTLSLVLNSLCQRALHLNSPLRILRVSPWTRSRYLREGPRVGWCLPSRARGRLLRASHSLGLCQESSRRRRFGLAALMAVATVAEPDWIVHGAEAVDGAESEPAPADQRDRHGRDSVNSEVLRAAIAAFIHGFRVRRTLEGRICPQMPPIRAAFVRVPNGFPSIACGQRQTFRGLDYLRARPAWPSPLLRY